MSQAVLPTKGPHTSELQRQRVLKRWRMQREKESSLTTKDAEERQRMLVTLIAFLQGDGALCKRYETGKEHKDIMFYPDSIDVANLFVEIYLKLYGRTLRIENLGNYFRVRTTHKRAYDELVSYCKFRSLEWRAPMDLFRNETDRALWLRAFFDCEAHVSKCGIVVQSVNKQGLDDVGELLMRFNITCRRYVYKRRQLTWNDNYILVIGRKEDRALYRDHIGFNHPKKHAALVESLARHIQQKDPGKTFYRAGRQGKPMPALGNLVA